MRHMMAFTLLYATAACTTARGGEYGSVQSPARPFGLDIVDLVQLRDSDTTAKDFKKEGWPWMKEVIKRGVTNELDHKTGTTMLLDPGRIQLLNDYSMRMYFLDESADFHHTLGFNANGTGVTPDAQLIFPDATDEGKRTIDAPLRERDFVDLGLIAGGSVLDFFLIADGAVGGTNVFTMDAGANPDGLNHAVVHARTDADSPYLLLGFEDALGGGGLDMDDVVLALDMGVENVRHLINTVGAPEPGSIAALSAFLTLGAVSSRRRRKRLGDLADRPSR